jgi:DNA-binding LacI/PurR family transcriptional regulator
MSDYRLGMAAVVEHFQKKGFDRIGFIKSRTMIGYMDDKEIALTDACRQRGLSMKTFLIGDDSRLGGREFVDNPDHTRAVITQSDEVAIGFIRGLRDKGFDIPKDFSIIGIDGTNICEYLQPQLSTIAHDKEAIMKYAVKTVISMIEDKEVPAENPMFPTRLILREST